ncbi:MAG: thiamine phosphate synthase, partial [Campylobacterales bacterium]|nr:thiamine phosphate synthase [Campylobacterales bacterium]
MLRGLYVITDEKLTPLDSMINQVRLSLEGGAKIIQFRFKSKIDDKVLQKIVELRDLVKSFEKIFIINDYVDLADEIGADGVH